MKKCIKMIALMVDVLFMPIRVIIGLEVVVTGAIMSDANIAREVKTYFETFAVYPDIVKNAARNILD